MNLPYLKYLRHGLSELFSAAKKDQVIKQSRRKVAEMCASGLTIKLEIGSGPRPGIAGWTTLDQSSVCDINWDLEMNLPFPDGSLSEIYTSHTLEHFTRDQIINLLQDCYRCLKPAGSLRVCVPNASIYIKAYLINPEQFHPVDVFQPAYQIDTPIDYINYTAYMCGLHKHMFDEDNLLVLMRKAGFDGVTLSKYDPDYDLEIRDWESIYAVASK